MLHCVLLEEDEQEARGFYGFLRQYALLRNLELEVHIFSDGRQLAEQQGRVPCHLLVVDLDRTKLVMVQRLQNLYPMAGVVTLAGTMEKLHESQLLNAMEAFLKPVGYIAFVAGMDGVLPQVMERECWLDMAAAL